MNIKLDNNIPFHKDFYHHVNNHWIKNNKIPDENMVWGTFNELNEHTYIKLKKLLKNNKDTIGSLYKQLLNKNRNNDPSHYINAISNITTIEELRKIIIDMHINGPISFVVAPNTYDSTTNILHIYTNGLCLPDREYYFNIKYKNIRSKYLLFIKKFMNSFNIKTTKSNYNSIYNIEKYIAKYTFNNVDINDVMKQTNIIYLNDIKYKYLYEDIIYFLETNNIPINNYKINITNPRFIIKYYKMLKTIDIEKLKQYYIYLFLQNIGEYVNFKIEKILFNFYNIVLSGVKIMKPLWKRAIDTLNNNVGELVGKIYVEKYFSKDKKKIVLQMCKYIINEIYNRLKTNKWLHSSTKQKAIEKLKKINIKIGYPDKWDNMKIIYTNNLLENILECNNYHFKTDIKMLYKKVDKSKWEMNPHEINAYYSPNMNEIVFPAGILQEPFFGNDIALNFGGIGTIIGHEIIHGFDDTGSKFDMNGNMKNWWTKNDMIEYKKRTNKLKKMFNNGELTLGENIADLGGVDISFNAMKKYYKKYKKSNITIEEQKKFFYNYAHIWKCNIRQEEATRRLLTDPHSPPCDRVNTILPNIDVFYQVFNISNTNSLMWLDPNKRITIW